MKSAQASDSCAASEPVVMQAARPAVGSGQGRRWRASNGLQRGKGLGYAVLARLLRSIHAYMSLLLADHELTRVVERDHEGHRIGVVSEFAPALLFNLARADERDIGPRGDG